LAKNFEAMVNKQTMQAFHLLMTRTMAIIGRKKACGRLNVPKTTLQDGIAWISWFVCSFIIAA